MISPFKNNNNKKEPYTLVIRKSIITYTLKSYKLTKGVNKPASDVTCHRLVYRFIFDFCPGEQIL